MTVPVLGSLLSMVIFGIVLPYRLGMSVRKALWVWSVDPQYHFRLEFLEGGLVGICLKEPEESRTCACCGKEFSNYKFLYEWKSGNQTLGLHHACLEGFCTLMGADTQTFTSLLRLSREFGILLQNDFPEMSNSLMEKIAYFRQLCGGQNFDSFGCRSLVRRPRLSPDDIP